MQSNSKQIQINEAAIHLFQKQGIHATSIADITKAANIAKGTFYLYYKNKEALFIELIINHLSSLLSHVITQDDNREYWYYRLGDLLVDTYFEEGWIAELLYQYLPMMMQNEQLKNQLLTDFDNLSCFSDDNNDSLAFIRFIFLLEFISSSTSLIHQQKGEKTQALMNQELKRLIRKLY